MGTRAHEDEGGLEVFIIPCAVSVKYVRSLVADGEEVGSWIVLPRRFEELFGYEL